jgi:hypothetical protein
MQARSTDHRSDRKFRCNSQMIGAKDGHVLFLFLLHRTLIISIYHSFTSASVWHWIVVWFHQLFNAMAFKAIAMPMRLWMAPKFRIRIGLLIYGSVGVTESKSATHPNLDLGIRLSHIKELPYSRIGP